MPLRRFIPAFLLLLIMCPAWAQAQKVTLSGYLRDARSGEALIAATVYVRELGLGAQTNAYGFYSVSVPPGSYTLVFSYVGYATQTVPLQLNESRTYNANLDNQAMMQEVEVRDSRKDEHTQGTEMGTVSLNPEQMKNLPVLFGEADILKTLQLLPGVQSAGEGNAGFYVRGGGPDQNLVLLDDAVVYNTGHLFGFFSIFNSDALRNTTLIKGGMPANYGGRLSSVVDVQMKEGNLKEYHAEGGIGLISSRLTVEGPIQKDKGSFMLSGRRTYIDLLIKPFTKGTDFEGSGYYFYDANLKANYRFGSKDRVYLSSYFGRDNFTFNNSNEAFSARIPWGNSTGTLRWNHLFSDRLFLNTTLVYNDYQFDFIGEQNDVYIRLHSGIRDYTAKSDLDYFSAFNHHFKAGVQYTYHKFVPSTVSGQANDSTAFEPPNPYTKYTHEGSVYVLDDFDASRWLKINAGLRYSLFAQTGPYAVYQYDLNGSKTDSTLYGKNNIVKTYGGLEPRLNVRFLLRDQSAVKASAARTYQYVHLVAQNGVTLPTDTWVPSTYIVQPQIAWQYSLGYFRNFLNNKLETSVELYYKDMKNQVEFKEGYIPTSIQDEELSFVFGKGYSYGAELFVNKTKGRFTGWIGYTLSWTWRVFPDLNQGRRFPAKYDRRHDLSVVGSYELNKRWTLSSVFVFGSGNAVTLPSNFYFISGQLAQEYSALNAYRIFPYHRLDLSVVYRPRARKPRKWQGSWNFSIYNVYSRQNPYFLYVDTRGNVNQGIDVKIKQVSIFPILPSITYNFKF